MNKKYLKLLQLILLLICNVSFHFAQNQGDIDTSFGVNGVIEYTLTINNTLNGVTFYDSYQLPNGKLLLVGVANNGCSSTSNYSGLLMRLHANGDLDTTFNTTGYKLIAQQSFKQIISISNNVFYLISVNGVFKIDANGNLDTSYATNGYKFLNMDCYNAALANSGNLYINARKYSGYTPIITKLDASGNEIQTFGTNAEVSFPHDYQFASLAVNANEEIFILGRNKISYSNTPLLVIKMNADGVLDSNFANLGIYSYSPASTCYASKIILNPDGSLFCSGSGTLSYSTGLGMILFRLLPNGTLDTSFAGNGITSIPVSSDSFPKKFNPIANGYIVTGNGNNNMFAIKIDTNGNPDASFGTNGKILTPTFDWTGFNASSLLIDDTILFIGNSAFADCAQQKYKGILTKYFYTENLSVATSSESEFSIFPNPANTFLKVNIASKNSRYQIFDVTGKLILKGKINSNGLIVLENIKKGSYFLVLENISKPFKFIKK